MHGTTEAGHTDQQSKSGNIPKISIHRLVQNDTRRYVIALSLHQNGAGDSDSAVLRDGLIPIMERYWVKILMGISRSRRQSGLKW